MSRRESRCKSCGERIVWMIGPKGGRMPVDEYSVPSVHDRAFARDRGHVSHWETCPDAKQFRRPERLRKLHPAVVPLLAIGGCLAGCSSPDDGAATLHYLQQGKARGHLVVTSGGQVGGETTAGLWIGARRSTVSFDGDVDFGDRTRHVSEPTP